MRNNSLTSLGRWGRLGARHMTTSESQTQCEVAFVVAVWEASHHTPSTLSHPFHSPTILLTPPSYHLSSSPRPHQLPHRPPSDSAPASPAPLPRFVATFIHHQVSLPRTSFSILSLSPLPLPDLSRFGARCHASGHRYHLEPTSRANSFRHGGL